MGIQRQMEKYLIYAFSVGKEMATQHLSSMFDHGPLEKPQYVPSPVLLEMLGTDDREPQWRASESSSCHVRFQVSDGTAELPILLSDMERMWEHNTTANATGVWFAAGR